MFPNVTSLAARAELESNLRNAVFTLIYERGALNTTTIGDLLHQLRLVKPITFSYIKECHGGLKVPYRNP